MISRLLIRSSFFILSTLCFINHIESTTAFGFTNVTDRQALLAIKGSITSDPFQALSSWNNSLHFCSWQGVTCGHGHQRVVALTLSSLQLTGSLSPHVGNLTFLRVIHLGTNNFHGIIPEEVAQLYRLRVLNLSLNGFQGELPRNLSQCSNLEFMSMGKNNLMGKIPGELGSLPKLEQLGLFKNHFTGTIPRSFGNLSSVVGIALMVNNLEGSIPIELGDLSNLEFLRLSFNKLSGMVPNRLYNISSLYHISVVDNQLSDSLPLDLGLMLPNLHGIYLGINNFFGTIPTSIANASRLVQIDFSHNALTGPIPKNLGTLQDLRFLNFGGNPLGGENANDLTFLTSLTNCTSLEQLVLFQSNLTGFLPKSIANLSANLFVFHLPANYIVGPIPEEIGNLKNLESLALNENMLTGRLPESIGKLSKLKVFYGYSNNITGEIPSFFGNLSELLVLNLEKNHLEGTVPVSLANCVHMEGLVLSFNKLRGVIPEKIFGLSSLTNGLFFGSNELTGPLPSQVGNLRNIVQLDISHNKLSGEIPGTLENSIMLENLSMQGNLFEGTIPSYFKKLRSLKVLDLSNNNLSGKIPEFLGELPILENLNLSFNNFEGQVPTVGIVFKNASAFSVAGNNKLCGGIKGIQLPACPETRHQNHFSRRVLMILVSCALFILLLLSCTFVVLCRKQLTKMKPSSDSALEKKYQKVSYRDLVNATDGFSAANVIGDGRYGTVYKAVFASDDQTVAVKVLKLEQRGATKTFVSECEALSCVRHRNLVRIITVCSTIDFKGNDFKALVFEFMHNGSLETWLHPSSMDLQDSKILSLLQRINISVDVASALDYLHCHCEKPLVHCDLKPSNILLDSDLTAHVSDFGLARILSDDTGEVCSAPSSSCCVRGTIGYVAPEYGMGGEVSIYGDAYSYGILLLEMFTGKRPTDRMFTVNSSLHNIVKAALPDQVLQIVDPLLTIPEEGRASGAGNSCSGVSNGKIGDCLVSIFRVGVQCSADSPRERMAIGDALAELNKIRNVLHRIYIDPNYRN